MQKPKRTNRTGTEVPPFPPSIINTLVDFEKDRDFLAHAQDLNGSMYQTVDLMEQEQDPAKRAILFELYDTMLPLFQLCFSIGMQRKFVNPKP